MTSQLKPLIDDTTKPAYIRDLLKQAKGAKEPPYDFDAGLGKHKTLIASSAPLPEWANRSLTGVTKATTLTARIVGIASVTVVGGMVAWNAFMASGNETGSYVTKPIQVVDAQKRPLNALPSDTAQRETNRTKQGKKSEAVENRSSASISASKGETIATRESLKRPARRRLHRHSPSEAIARSQIDTVRPADEEASDEPTTNRLNDIEVVPDEIVNAPVVAPVLKNEPDTKATPPSDDTLQREMKLLAEARRLIDVSPLQSLALARARHPRTGILNEEWDQVGLIALIKLGRIDDAKDGVKRFRNRYPNSAFNERLQNELLPPRK